MPIRRDNDQDGESALHKACRYEHETIAQFLAEQMTREAIVALNRVSTMHSTSPNLESYSASVSLSLSLSLSLCIATCFALNQMSSILLDPTLSLIPCRSF